MDKEKKTSKLGGGRENEAAVNSRKKREGRGVVPERKSLTVFT